MIVNRELPVGTKEIASIVAVYIVLCLIFFSPLHIAHKVAVPLLFLSVAAVRLRSLPMFLAMLFSAIGDYAGSCHIFLLQMGSFALAHIAFITYFGGLIHRQSVSLNMRKASPCALVCSLWFMSVVIAVLPTIGNSVFLTGVSVYITLIITMFMLAWLTGRPMFLIGAFLFLLSDTILGCNKFVTKVPYSAYWIMVTYYSAQILLFVQACRLGGTKKR